MTLDGRLVIVLLQLQAMLEFPFGFFRVANVQLALLVLNGGGSSLDVHR